MCWVSVCIGGSLFLVRNVSWVGCGLVGFLIIVMFGCECSVFRFDSIGVRWVLVRLVRLSVVIYSVCLVWVRFMYSSCVFLVFCFSVVCLMVVFYVLLWFSF